MPRVKGGPKTRRRHKRILNKTKGYRGARSRLFRTAREAWAKALQYAYRDRRRRKGDFRRLWIIRINAACREHGLSYGRFIDGLNRAGVKIDRKQLAGLALDHPDAFAELVSVAQAHHSGPSAAP